MTLYAVHARIYGPVLAGAFVLLAAIYTVTGIAIFEARQRALAVSETELHNTAATAADQIDRVFDAARVFQTGLADRIRDRRPASVAEFAQIASSQESRLALEREAPGLPQVGGVGYIDAHGRTVSHSPAWPLLADDLVNDLAFVSLRSDRGTPVALSEPKYNRIRKAWFIIMARRVTAPNGEFLGAVALSIPLEHLARLAELYSPHPGISITLFGSNSARLVPPPDLPGAAAPAVAAPTKSGRLKRGPGQAVTGPPGQIAITHSIPRYGLIVAITATESSLLGGWPRNATYVVIIAVLATALIGAGLVYVVINLAERHPEAERQASDAQAPKLDVILDNTPIGISVFDRDQRLVASNKRYAEIYGFTPDQAALGTPLSEIVEYHIASGTYEGDSPEDYRTQAVNAALERVASSMQIFGRSTADVEALGGPWTPSMRKLKDGRVIALRRSPMPNGGWLGTHQDVTQYEDLRHEHDRSITLIGSIVENIPLMLFVKDARSLRYLLINRVGEQLFGRSRDEIIGKTASEIFPKEQADKIMAEDREFLTSSEQKHVADRSRVMFDGAHLHRVTRVKVGGQGEARFILCVVEEIDQQQASVDVRLSA